MYLEAQIIADLERMGREMNPPVSKSVVVEMLVREKLAHERPQHPSSRQTAPPSGMRELETPFSAQGKVFGASMDDAQLLALKAEELVDEEMAEKKRRSVPTHRAQKPAPAKHQKKP
jgi:hypothetical protein